MFSSKEAYAPCRVAQRIASSTVRTLCGPLGIVDINWLNNYLSTVVLPALASQGVNSGSFPVFQLYNVLESTQVTSLAFCCILGYHSVSGPPIQTYAVADFDTSNFFWLARKIRAFCRMKSGSG